MPPAPAETPGRDTLGNVIPFDKESEIRMLQQEIEILRQKVGGLIAQNRMLVQANHALGDYNRYFASQKLGRPATDNEAFLHYVYSGGKKRFDATHPDLG